VDKKMTLSLIVAFLVLTIACNKSDRNERIIPMEHGDIVAVQYWSNDAAETLPLIIVIDSAGMCYCTMSTSRESLFTEAVGTFYSACPQDYYAQLLGTVTQADFLSMSKPGAILPGEVVRKISIQFKDGGDTVKYVGGSKAAPPAFVKAEQIFKKIITETLRFPGVSLSTLPLQFPQKANTSLVQKFYLVFVNKGKMAVKFADPHIIDSQETSFELGMIRADIPLDKIATNDQMFISLESTDIVDIKATNRSKGSIVLEPGDSVVIEFEIRFNEVKGAYKVWISSIMTLYSIDDKPVCRIELITEKNRVDFY
jgi:hypothetical protein